MRTYYGCGLALLFVVVPVRATQPERRAEEDVWNVAYLEGARAGFVHTSVREITEKGGKVLRTMSELDLTLRRQGQLIRMRMKTGSEETPDGKVTGVFMDQYQGDRPQLSLKGVVVDGQLEVNVNGSARLHTRVPWNDEVIGLYRQQHLFQERKVKPGDKFSFLSFEPVLSTVVTNRVTVKDYEEVQLLKTKKRLLRVETVPDKVDAQGSGVQLPGLTSWLDEDLLPVRSTFEMPGLGTLVLYRGTKKDVEARGPPPELPDILKKSVIPIRTVIAQPDETLSAVYRITVKGEADPATAFVQDSRQKPKNVKGDTFNLYVRAKRAPEPVANAEGPKGEFLESCHWINSDDPRIQAYARQAVGKETDPWAKARCIEGWVHSQMRVAFDEPFAPAGEAARTLRGDCRQYCLLTTAMCRAAGVPSRTALGLCYGNDRQRGPVMAFHMWTEVWVNGDWVGIDATRGQGYVGATHIKISDHSWHNTQSLTPLLPVFRVLGKLSIDVVSINRTE
jgi:hypothetical protein